MSRTATLEAELNRWRLKLQQMPPRPGGSPWGLREYANALLLEHETLGLAAASERKVPEGLDFKGPAADAFRTNAEDASAEIGRLANAVHEVAMAVREAAHTLEGQLADWDRSHNEAVNHMDQIKAQLRNAR